MLSRTYASPPPPLPSLPHSSKDENITMCFSVGVSGWQTLKLIIFLLFQLYSFPLFDNICGVSDARGAIPWRFVIMFFARYRSLAQEFIALYFLMHVFATPGYKTFEGIILVCETWSRKIMCSRTHAHTQVRMFSRRNNTFIRFHFISYVNFLSMHYLSWVALLKNIRGICSAGLWCKLRGNVSQPIRTHYFIYFQISYFFGNIAAWKRFKCYNWHGK